MEAMHIKWTWETDGINAPCFETQNYIQTLSLGVIMAHKQGIACPTNRSKSTTVERPFSAEDDNDVAHDLADILIKDEIFNESIEATNIRIYYCWNSVRYLDDDSEQDLDDHYLVIVEEIGLEQIEDYLNKEI